jgi:hypothetical protein
MAAHPASAAPLLTNARSFRSLDVCADVVYRGWWWFYGRPSEEAVCA